MRSCIQTCVLQPRQRTRAVARGTPPSGTPRSERAIDDVLLLESLRRGDAEARVMMLERFEPFIERLVVGVLGFRDDIPDIVTEVFVLALERIPQLKGSSVLPLWIGGLAVLAARDRIRRDRWRRRLRFFVPGDDATADGPATSPECCALLRGAYRALGALPDEERIALSLRYVADIAPAEIAAICATDLETIERRIARGMERFGALMARDPGLQRSGRSEPAAPIVISRHPAR